MNLKIKRSRQLKLVFDIVQKTKIDYSDPLIRGLTNRRREDVY